MGRKSSLTKDQKKAILELHNSNYSQKQIAELYDVTQSYVSKIIKKLNSFKSSRVVRTKYTFDIQRDLILGDGLVFYVAGCKVMIKSEVADGEKLIGTIEITEGQGESNTEQDQKSPKDS